MQEKQLTATSQGRLWGNLHKMKFCRTRFFLTAADWMLSCSLFHWLAAREVSRERLARGCVLLLVCLYQLCLSISLPWSLLLLELVPSIQHGVVTVLHVLEIMGCGIRSSLCPQRRGVSPPGLLFMRSGTDGDHAKELQSAEDPAHPYTEYSKSLCNAYLQKKDCQIMLTLWRDPKTRTQPAALAL